MGRVVLAMTRDATEAALRADDATLTDLAARDDDVDDLYRRIVDYLRRIGQHGMTAVEADDLARLIRIANALEQIGDTIETNLVDLGRDRLRDGLHISTDTLLHFAPLTDQVVQDLERVIDAVQTNDGKTAKAVVAGKPEFKGQLDDLTDHLTKRLSADEPNRLLAFRTESDLAEQFKRLHAYVRRIAKAVMTN